MTDKRVFGGIFVAVFFMTGILFWVLPATVKAEELDNLEEIEETNGMYDTLKEKIRDNWDQGLSDVKNVDTIKITGNLAERILRSIAAVCYRNLRSIKAGALLIGVISFIIGSVITILASNDKKIRKRAVMIGMAAVPMLLLLLVFSISWYISFFK